MSARVYTIEDLLVGQGYTSETITGKIVSAQKDERGISYGDEYETYLVQVSPTLSGWETEWRTIAVKVKA